VDSFHLHNRGLNEGESSVSMTRLEESASDRKNQLEGVLLQLKRIATHLQSITDEQVLEGDWEE
jgi:hypothetical protein